MINLKDGNFIWSGQIAIFIFFFVNIQLYLNVIYDIKKYKNNKLGLRLYLPAIILFFSLLSGIIYFIRYLSAGVFY